MLKRYFIRQGIKEVQIQRFIKGNFPNGDYSDIVLQRTPLGLKIVIHTNKPGKIIGRGGSNINMITDALKERFKLENPQIDIKSIENPDLDAKIVAKQIASALEKGYNYKKIGNLTLRRIMNAGALGTQIIIAGKLGGSKGRTAKFTEGYLKHCGDPVKQVMDFGYEEANTRPGKIGIKVKIMREFIDITGQKISKQELLERSMPKREIPEEKPAEAKKEEAKPGEKPEKEKKGADKKVPKKGAKPSRKAAKNQKKPAVKKPAAKKKKPAVKKPNAKATAKVKRKKSKK